MPNPVPLLAEDYHNDEVMAQIDELHALRDLRDRSEARTTIEGDAFSSRDSERP